MRARRLSQYLITKIACLIMVMMMCGPGIGVLSQGRLVEMAQQKSLPPPVASDNKPAIQTNTSAKASVTKDNQKEAKKEEASTSNAPPVLSAQEKEELVQATVAEVSSCAYQIEPIEYGILTQVETAALLWGGDRDRATDELTKACSRLRELLVEKKESSKVESLTQTKTSEVEKKQFRMAIVRRIARLNPDLIKSLMETSADDKTKASPFTKEPDEAWAIMAVATEEITHDPKLAVQLAQQGLSFGAINSFHNFITHLSFQDKELSGQLAIAFLNKLRGDSSVSAVAILDLRYFIPPSAMDYYFESLVMRLRLGLRPSLRKTQYNDLIFTANKVLPYAAPYPQWSDELARLIPQFEALLASQSLPTPTPAPAKNVDVSGMLPPTPGETKEIADAASQADAIITQRNKDLEYQKLATEAAGKADAELADKLFSKIKDEELRRKASLSVYGPLTRKALSERNWFQARAYALKVTDPLEQSLVVDWVAKAMLAANQDKQMVKEVYDAVLTNLHREVSSVNVARGFLYLAKSLLTTEPEKSFEIVNSAVSTLNNTDLSKPFSKQSSMNPASMTWVSMNQMLSVDENFDLTETLGPLFKEMSKRDAAKAREIAFGLSHPGLRSLAQLGIAREMVDEIKVDKRSSEKANNSK